MPKCAYVAKPLTEQETINVMSACPVVRMGKNPEQMVPVGGGYYIIDKTMCIGCNICAKKAPGKITMIDW